MRTPVALAAALLLSLTAALSGAQGISVSTEDDLVANNPTPDDLYTFSVRIDARLHGFAVSLHENAFTDRAAATRFDETYLSLGRRIPAPGPWDLAAEVGVVHVGRGLFGQRAQNAVHRLFGCDPVHLRYIGSSLHPRVALTAERRSTVGRSFAVGPRLELDVVPGLRSWALLAARATWRAAASFELELLAGTRFTKASFRALAPHLAATAPAARIGVLIGRRFYLSWSYNDYGDKREHLTAGYRLGVGGRTARSGAATGDGMLSPD